MKELDSEITTQGTPCGGDCATIIDLPPQKYTERWTEPDSSCYSKQRAFSQERTKSGKERRTDHKVTESYPVVRLPPISNPNADFGGCPPCQSPKVIQIECGEMYQTCPRNPGDSKDEATGEKIDEGCVPIPV